MKGQFSQESIQERRQPVTVLYVKQLPSTFTEELALILPRRTQRVVRSYVSLTADKLRIELIDPLVLTQKRLHILLHEMLWGLLTERCTDIRGLAGVYSKYALDFTVDGKCWTRFPNGLLFPTADLHPSHDDVSLTAAAATLTALAG